MWYLLEKDFGALKKSPAQLSKCTSRCLKQKKPIFSSLQQFAFLSQLLTAEATLPYNIPHLNHENHNHSSFWSVFHNKCGGAESVYSVSHFRDTLPISNQIEYSNKDVPKVYEVWEQTLSWHKTMSALGMFLGLSLHVG
jgi:hypothetical protein